MTEETYRKGPFTTDVQRLDYSKPPPGYLVHDLNDDGWWWRIDELEDGCVSPYATEAEAIVSAWGHYKNHSDPPGMVVVGTGDVSHGAVGLLHPFLSSTDAKENAARRVAARTSAWVWYDRRLTMAATCPCAPWPRCLAWSDHNCDQNDVWCSSFKTTETTIQRLDYSKPPPGYAWLDLGLELAPGCAPLASAWSHYKASSDPPGLTVAWEPADRCCGPDGAGDWEVTLISPTGTTEVVWWSSVEAKGAVTEIGTVSVAARVAAWAWHDRRLALWRKLEHAEVVTRQYIADDFWPAIVSWSDEQVAAAERWLVDSTMELPEVLGGSAHGDPNADDPPGTYSPIEVTSAAADDGSHVCTGCIGDGPCDALEAEIEAEDRDADEFMDDGQCSPMPQSEHPSGAEVLLGRCGPDPTGRDWNRQAEEHAATTLAILNFRDPPLGWIWIGEDRDQGCALAEGVLSLLELQGVPVARAWESHKLSHDPPGMWCGFSRDVYDLDNCSIRVGVHACGSRRELQPDIVVPYKGFTAKAREWAWAWHDRRHSLMAKIGKITDFTGRGPFHEALRLLLLNKAPFHRVLCWHNEWVDEVEAWIEKPSSPVPEALR